MKKQFIGPTAEVKVLSSETDVIRTSGGAVELNEGYNSNKDSWNLSSFFSWLGF